MSQRRRARHHFAQDHRWCDALLHALEESTGTPKDARLTKPTIRLLSVNASGNRMEIEMRFRSGETYCCAELGCHVATHDAEWWKSFRSCISRMTDRDPPPMTLTIYGVIDAGARLLSSASLGLPIVSSAYTVVHGPNHERD